jgi:hypothetical protein
MRPKIEWPDGTKICATFTVAFEAFTRGGHFKKAKGLEARRRRAYEPGADSLVPAIVRQRRA